MTDEPTKPAVDIDRPKPNYPLMIIGGFVFLCLVGLIALAYSSGAWALLILAMFALAGSIAFVYFHSAKRPLGLQHRLEWQPPLTPGPKKKPGLLIVRNAASLLL